MGTSDHLGMVKMFQNQTVVMCAQLLTFVKKSLNCTSWSANNNEALFTREKLGNTQMSTNKCMDKQTVNIHTMEYYSAIRRNELLLIHCIIDKSQNNFAERKKPDGMGLKLDWTL